MEIGYEDKFRSYTIKLIVISRATKYSAKVSIKTDINSITFIPNRWLAHPHPRNYPEDSFSLPHDPLLLVERS